MPAAIEADADYDVFISYTHADMAAAERLHVLLTALEPQPLVVWRDVMRLTPGEQINSTVSQALRASRVVVGLWSRNVEANADWVTSETNYALHAGKYVALSLDGFDHSKLPAPHKPHYCASFEACMADPTRLLDRIMRLRDASLQMPLRKLPPAMLPYTVDCSTQVDILKQWLAPYCAPPSAANRGKRPLFVLKAVSDDDPESLVARIVRQEIASLRCGDRVPEQEPLLIPWPAPGRYRREALKSAIRSAIGPGCGARAERFAIRHSIVVDPTGADLALVADWIDNWDSQVDETCAAIPLLIVVTASTRWWMPWTRAESYANDIANLVGGYSGKRTEGVELPALQPISHADALLWDVYRHLPSPTRIQLSDFIEAQFKGAWRVASPRLRQFAQTIAAAEWWREFTQNQG